MGGLSPGSVLRDHSWLRRPDGMPGDRTQVDPPSPAVLSLARGFLTPIFICPRVVPPPASEGRAVEGVEWVI